MANHTHACTICGDVWEHDRAHVGDWHKEHTCRNGHRVTIKLEPDIAGGMATHCKAGGDGIAYLKDHDPISALWAELDRDVALSDLMDDIRHGADIPRGALGERAQDWLERLMKAEGFV